jgi:acyl-CoA synthetase (NDP forming)/L-amino acid N-acyltransferase YncA
VIADPLGPTSTDALAADGGIIQLRSVSAEDRTALRDLFARASDEALRRRFFGIPTPGALEREIERLIRAAAPDHEVLVALEFGAVIGVASYERLPPDSGSAEFAVYVDEAEHKRGVGTLLLEHLADRARRLGVSELVGEVLSANGDMLRVVRNLDHRASLHLDAGVFDVRLHTRPDESALAVADARDRAAASASLRPLLAPRVVAVAGAGRRPGGVGNATLQAMIEYGFTGQLYAVNPHATDILGVPAFPTVGDIPEGVDLVVIAVPAAMVPTVMADAASAGARAAVVLTAGFGEVGAAGGQSQTELVRLARQHGMRIVGPNCLGVLNTDPSIRLAATFAPALPPPGGLALASQSGAIGIAVLDHAARTGVGVSTFVSLGNKADVSGNDLLSYWYDDPATKAVALYLESFGNPRRFARIARSLARRKPVIAVISGRSSAGQRAGISHTAAAASPAMAVDTLCAQAGIIRVDHLGDLLDTARMVTDQPLPGGLRLAIVGNAGGVNVLAADAAEAAGLVVPRASDTLSRLGVSNPLDLGAGATAESFARSLDLVCGSREFDAAVAVVAATRANDIEGVLAALSPVLDRYRELPLNLVVLGATADGAVGTRRVPVFDLPERAVTALARAARYAAWLREPIGHDPLLSDVDPASARSVVHRALEQGGGWQTYDKIADLLGRYGIAVVPTVTAVGAPAALSAARRLGLPVVLKAADPNLVHKSDIGGVRLNLTDEQGVVAAYHAIGSALEVAEPAVLVQPMASAQVELVAGIAHDRLFGSLVMVGLGGVHTELFADRAFTLVPMTDRDASRMWRSLRAASLLTGYRGSPPVDTDAVEDLLLRLGRLAEDLPEVAELDLNPILVSATGAMVVDAKLRLADIGAEPDAMLRQLRRPS